MIESSWARSRRHGVRADAAPRLVRSPIDEESGLVRAADPVLGRTQDELDGLPAALLLADRSARVLDTRFTDVPFSDAVADIGIAPGVLVEEEQIGTNGVGTSLETGQELFIRGSEHFLRAFDPFSCYGHPVVHPVTRRVEGVVNVACLAGAEHPLLPSLIRHVVKEIQDRLRQDSPLGQRRLLAAFQAAARHRGRAVVALGPGLVLANPPALDLLQPADHPAIQACADAVGPVRERTHRLVLASGWPVELTCTPVEGTDGVLVVIVPQRGSRRDGARTEAAAQWPLLVVGEPGSGRTTEARRAAGSGAVTLDCAAVVLRGETSWAGALGALLDGEGPAVVLENIEFLSERLTMLLAKSLPGARRSIIMTSTPGGHLEGVHAPLVGVCATRQDLLPLRRRRHEIPRLAQEMLSETSAFGRVRLTTETLRLLAAQPWPGNLAELRRAVHGLAQVRTAGDILPSDLPVSHRDRPSPASPFRQAEREVIIAAIEAANGNRREAARALGVSRSTLYNRMRALRIH
ncbi:helix-turn-helix domain-containing protein [Streptomyces sp. NPDC049590]|uniref:sigma-54-dependent Fis family transcriptional regulator n=1 Tax=Streptomyces sp. NPDC049590 TaxID=3154834 RepID=UPI0034185A29